MKVSNRKKNIRVSFMRSTKKQSICPNCGCNESHYIPPMFQEAGFFTCKERKKL